MKPLIAMFVLIVLNETTPLLSQRGLTTCSAKENEMAVEILPVETWKDIAGFEGLYQASDQGHIRSLDRRLLKSDGTTQLFHGRVLRPSVHKDGYHCVNLQRQGVIIGRLVHVLVYETFTGQVPHGLEVNHDDGRKNNCALSNLTVMTPSENCRHRDRMGLRTPARGEASGRAKLTSSQVLEIVPRLELQTDTEIAPHYGVGPTSIGNIRHGKTWSHLTGIGREVAA